MTAPTPESPLDVGELKRLAAGAPPGQWRVDVDRSDGAGGGWVLILVVGGVEYEIATGGLGLVDHHPAGLGPTTDAAVLAELIAAAVNQLPAILAALTELEGLRSALREIREGQGKVCSDYEMCRHVACQSSYASWAIADQALHSSVGAAQEVSRG